MNFAKSSQDFEDLTTAEIVAWALENYNPRIGLACSFQAEESVLIDLMHRVRGADFRLLTLDTGRLNQETYDCMDAIRERYGVQVEVFSPTRKASKKWCGRTG